MFALLPQVTFAAETFFETENTQIRVGDKFEVGFFLNTENEDINAIEGEIIVPETLLKLKEIKSGSSIVNFWIENPQMVNGNIPFSGIIPGGYSGQSGLVLSLVFQPIQKGQGLIEVRSIKTLINNGQGTETKTSVHNLYFIIAGQAPLSQSTVVEKKDTDAPETFEPVIASDSTVFDGKYFLAFSTQDKESGVDHYEIQESRNIGIQNEQWITGESPYLLQDQDLRSYVYVKAVDKNSNERIAVLPPQKPLSLYRNYWILGILVMIGLVVAAINLRKILWQT
ncbi:MAG: hypothetical protein A3H06_01755 [Candidatus Colwellbacteria bacterium RIFCSPLOWO2_12_FULL_44_13]|uniref:Cohesin domain-containing protein n=1 Tax=Candidatus Colwellbacteria bacterium RIFCSPLOWO2_12_FULL_44_13 TaxID=1797694 RepID=A0A1G1ZBJ4_9BACT|nr:MAG: hypothetical protein A3H06_01755 [Candidatus Colwellbacteria bacterium RIFCSPLOWO2_12_FULL_44_13]